MGLERYVYTYLDVKVNGSAGPTDGSHWLFGQHICVALCLAFHFGVHVNKPPRLARLAAAAPHLEIRSLAYSTGEGEFFFHVPSLPCLSYPIWLFHSFSRGKRKIKLSYKLTIINGKQIGGWSRRLSNAAATHYTSSRKWAKHQKRYKYTSYVVQIKELLLPSNLLPMPEVRFSFEHTD